MRKPINEMGVVSLFSQYAQSLGYCIMEIQAAFPDATVAIINTGKLLRVEFEYKSRNFKAHGHDPNGCDLIICWEDNWPECPVGVIELSKVHFGEPTSDLLELKAEIERLKKQIARGGERFQNRASAQAAVDKTIEYIKTANPILVDFYCTQCHCVTGKMNQNSGTFVLPDGKSQMISGAIACPNCGYVFNFHRSNLIFKNKIRSDVDFSVRTFEPN